MNNRAPVSRAKDSGVKLTEERFSEAESGVVDEPLLEDQSTAPREMTFSMHKSYVDLQADSTESRLTGVACAPGESTRVSFEALKPKGFKSYWPFLLGLIPLLSLTYLCPTSKLWLLALVFGIVVVFPIFFIIWVNRQLSKPIFFDLLDDGIEFDRCFRFVLLKRLYREWSDVQSIDFVYSSAAKKGWWQDEWDFIIIHGPKLYIDFASGGAAPINLARLSVDSKISLFTELEKHVPLTKFSAMAIKAKEEALSEVRSLSYTELWNDDIAMRHASTNFMPLPRGHLLQSGRIRVMAELATGGLSAVYLVELRDRKARLVLKESVLPLDMNDELKAKARELFQREVRILTALNHKRIVGVVDCFVERGRDYLLLEHIPGRTLRQIAAGSPLSSQRALRLARQIAEIVSYLHTQQPPVVHRDLTPDNLLVTDDDEIYLIDFGASNEFVGIATGTTIGKKSYIAPEQFRGKAQPASDLYSFGATLFFMLSGKDPIALSTSMIECIAGLSEQLGKIVEKCTQLEVEDRYESISAISADLDALEGM